MAKKRKHAKAGKTNRKTAKQAEADVISEVVRLGKQVQDALKSAVTSKEVKNVQAEVKRSVSSMSTKLQNAIESARKSDEGRRIAEQAKKVFRTGRRQGTDTAKKIQTNLSAGLKTLSSELEKLAGRIKK